MQMLAADERREIAAIAVLELQVSDVSVSQQLDEEVLQTHNVPA
jgi:hypothetical protein